MPNVTLIPIAWSFGNGEPALILSPQFDEDIHEEGECCAASCAELKSKLHETRQYVEELEFKLQTRQRMAVSSPLQRSFKVSSPLSAVLRTRQNPSA